MQKYISNSTEETKQIAAKTARHITRGVIALTGGLGAGKTTFVQGFAKGLRIKEKIISPTFVLIRQHQIPDTNRTLYHIDLYRVEKKDELKNLGLEELLNESNHLILIEWAEKAKELLPKNTIWVSIEIVKENIRQISVQVGYIKSL